MLGSNQQHSALINSFMPINDQFLEQNYDFYIATRILWLNI